MVNQARYKNNRSIQFSFGVVLLSCKVAAYSTPRDRNELKSALVRTWNQLGFGRSRTRPYLHDGEGVYVTPLNYTLTNERNMFTLSVRKKMPETSAPRHLVLS
ncbi:hypothetical protein TNCV_2946641 [Trichonephila clavipes]|nr:hypothetical protein TNCV_2946641 [Trichonephila clavipes]